MFRLVPFLSGHGFELGSRRLLINYNILVELLLCVSLLKVLLVPDTMPRTNDGQVPTAIHQIVGSRIFEFRIL